jgi:hypothetical protein
MGRKLKICFWLGMIGVLAACGTTQEARQEDKAVDNFNVALAERQVARRRQHADACRRQGVVLPAKYQEKGGGMLEEYVPSRPPCGISALERTVTAEADWRATWKAVVGNPVPVGYEWLLAGKRRIAAWVDSEGLTPEEGRIALREAQWILAEWEQSGALPTSAGPGEPSGETEKALANINAALNQALAEQGIICRQHGQAHQCF